MNGMEYTSGIITTIDSFSFTYGYVEMRARIPAGQGLWPAFWLTNDREGDQTPWSEIDIFEFLGHEPHVVYLTLHYKDEKGKSQEIGTHINAVDYSTDFHTFALNWTPEAVTWYIDDIEQYRLTEHVPHTPLYLIANLQIGGNWPGAPDETTVFPASYQIDYIRVYQPPR